MALFSEFLTLQTIPYQVQDVLFRREEDLNNLAIRVGSPVIIPGPKPYKSGLSSKTL